MSRVNDGAGATDERNDEDAGITSHGVCRADQIRPGMLMHCYGEWMPVRTVRIVDGLSVAFTVGVPEVIVRLVVRSRGSIVKVRDRLHTYTDIASDEGKQ